MQNFVVSMINIFSHVFLCVFNEHPDNPSAHLNIKHLEINANKKLENMDEHRGDLEGEN